MLFCSALNCLYASLTSKAHVLDPLPLDRQPPSKPIIPYRVFNSSVARLYKPAQHCLATLHASTSNCYSIYALVGLLR